MSKSVGEIQKLIDNFEKRHQDLFRRMDADYNLWKLKSYTVIDKWSDSVIYNEPRTFADSIMQELETARLSITIRREDKNEKKQSLMEYFLISAFASADDKLANRIVNGANLRASLRWYAAIRGFVAGRVTVNKRDGELDIEILPYDPKFLAYNTDGRGIILSGYTTWRDPASIESEYKKAFKAFDKYEEESLTGIKVIDFWNDERNIVVIGDEKAQDEKHKLKRPPVIVVPVGSMPLVVQSDGKYGEIKNWGESIFASKRDLYKIQNETLSIWFTLLKNAQKPSFWIFDDALGGKVVATPWGRGEAIALSSNARVQAVEPPDIARSTPDFLGKMDEGIQKGSRPSLWYGQVRKGLDPSGSAISQLLQGSESVVNPIIAAMSQFYKMAARKLIEQYSYTGVSWDVRGYDTKGREFHETIKPGDIKGNYDIDIQFVSILPEEEAANYAKAQMATDPNNPLVSNSYARENLLKVQDPPKMEDDLQIQQGTELDPNLKLLEIIKAYDGQNKKDEADVLRMQLAGNIRQIQSQGLPIAKILMEEVAKLPAMAPAPAPPMGGMPPPTGAAMPEEEVAARLEGVVGGM